jgi:hypothetical protein
MCSGHHSCGSIEHRSELVPVAQLGLAGCQSHSHRQLQLPLRVDRGAHGGHRRREGRHETIARVAEQEPVIRLDRRAQHLVVDDERRPHRLRIGLPPTGRTLHIGEQKRHHPRRSSGRRRSGHPCRISQQTRSYLPHRRNPAQTTAPRRGVAATRWPDRSGDMAHAGWLVCVYPAPWRDMCAYAIVAAAQ